MSITPTRAPFWLLIGGAWKQLDGATPGVVVSNDRAGSMWESLGGVRRSLRAAKSNRGWALGFHYEDAEAGRWLDFAASGKAGPVYLLDQLAAQVNMLRPVDTTGVLAAATLVSVEDVPMKAFAAADGFTRKIRDGVYYHLSYTTTHTAGATIGTYDLGAGPVNIVAPPSTGTRRGSVTFLATDDVDLEVEWTVANKTTAARLSEGSLDTFGFIEGRNTPCQVVVSDAQVTALMTREDDLALCDYAYSLTEVGS